MLRRLKQGEIDVKQTVSMTTTSGVQDEVSYVYISMDYAKAFEKNLYLYRHCRILKPQIGSLFDAV